MADTVALQQRPLEERGHRPWPLPEGPWLQGQTWCDLLFAHWQVPKEALDRLLPVEVGGKPGIYFFSLDAASRLAVFAARRAYRLPYFHARMRVEKVGARIDYESVRIDDSGPPASFRGSYGPVGALHHPPWPLQPAEADLDAQGMAAQLGIELEGEPLLHFSARQDTLIWPLRPVD